MSSAEEFLDAYKAWLSAEDEEATNLAVFLGERVREAWTHGDREVRGAALYFARVKTEPDVLLLLMALADDDLSLAHVGLGALSVLAWEGRLDQTHELTLAIEEFRLRDPDSKVVCDSLLRRLQSSSVDDA